MTINTSIITGIRWFARIVGSILVLLVLAIAIGEMITEPPPRATGKITPRDIPLFIGLILMVAGIIVAWFKEGIGGLLTVGGFIIFLVAHFIFYGNIPGVPIFIIFLITGLLFIFCSWQSRKVAKQEL